MDEFIKKQEALNTYCTDCCIGCGDSMCSDWNKIREWISGIPAADVAPVVRGRWIKLDVHNGMEQHKCSVCNQECYVPTCMGEPLYAYCPNCGADMWETTDGNSNTAEPH